MDINQKPPFPWTFLSGPDGPDAELAAEWIFVHLKGRAYQGFLDIGPGVLVGPFFDDGDNVLITCGEAIQKREKGETVGISVMYLPALSHEFSDMVPVGSVREAIYTALNQYNPEHQCVVLLRHDDTAVSVSIIGVEEKSEGPRAACFREFLNESVPAGLPN